MLHARAAYGGFEVDEEQSTQCVSWQRVGKVVKLWGLGKVVKLWGVRVGEFEGS